MSTYRTGNHWGVTIVREAVPHPGPDHWHEGGPCPECPRDAELVAVVTNGDRKLAERISALLNGEGSNPRGYHPTCVETTSHVERAQNIRSFICGPDCPPASEVKP